MCIKAALLYFFKEFIMDDFGKVASGDSLPQMLTIACDVSGTLLSRSWGGRNSTDGFFKAFVALYLLKKQGHNVHILSSRVASSQPTLDAMLHLLERKRDCLPDFEGDDLDGALLSDVRKVESKASWGSVCDGDGHINIILDDEVPGWCDSYDVHVDANKLEFDTFIDSVLDNPAQDLMVLIQCIWSDPEPGPVNEL